MQWLQIFSIYCETEQNSALAEKPDPLIPVAEYCQIEITKNKI